MDAAAVPTGRSAGQPLAVRVAVVALIGAAGVFGASFVWSGGSSAGHAWGHLAGAAAAPLVAAAVAAFWRSRSRAESAARRALVGALWLFAGAQAAEAVGAFGWEDDALVVRSPALQALHDGALAVGLVSLLLTVLLLAASVLLLSLRLVRRALSGRGRA